MTRTLALMERELRSAVRSPVAFAVVGVYLGLHGLFYAQLLEEFSVVSFQAIANGAARDEHNLMDMVLRPLLMADTFVLMVLLPALTMRLLAEEWKQGTSDLLMSYPMHEREIVFGKYLASLVVLFVLVVVGAIYPALASLFGRVEFGALASAVLGLFLYGAAVLAIGLFFSSLTENQVIAMVSTLLALLAMTVLGYWGGRVDPPLSSVLRHVSLGPHVETFGFGVIRLSDCVFFVSLTGFFLYWTIGVLESRRGRWGGRR